MKFGPIAKWKSHDEAVSPRLPLLIDHVGDKTWDSVDDDLRSRPLPDGDGFGGPAVTSSRCGHCHPSPINIGPRSGGRGMTAGSDAHCWLDNNTMWVIIPGAL